MRYINIQKHKSSCGPIAVINAIKWLGGKLSYKYLDMFEAFGWTKKGMDTKQMMLILDTFGVEYQVIFNPSTRFIENSLSKGNAAILMFRWFLPNKNCDHATFVYKNHRSWLDASNTIPCGFTILPKKILTKFLNTSRRKGFPSIMVEILG